MRVCLNERPTHNFIFTLRTAGGQVYIFSAVTAGEEKTLQKSDARSCVVKSPEALNNSKTSMVMEPTSSVTVLSNTASMRRCERVSVCAIQSVSQSVELERTGGVGMKLKSVISAFLETMAECFLTMLCWAGLGWTRTHQSRRCGCGCGQWTMHRQ